MKEFNEFRKFFTSMKQFETPINHRFCNSTEKTKDVKEIAFHNAISSTFNRMKMGVGKSKALSISYDEYKANVQNNKCGHIFPMTFTVSYVLLNPVDKKILSHESLEFNYYKFPQANVLKSKALKPIMQMKTNIDGWTHLPNEEKEKLIKIMSVKLKAIS